MLKSYAEVTDGNGKRKKFLVNLLYFGVMLLLAFVALRYALPLVMPFAIAAVTAYLLRKPVCLLEKKLHLPGKLAAVSTVILFYGAAGALLVLLSIKAASGVADIVGVLPHMYETHLFPFFMEVLWNVEEAFVGMDAGLVSALDKMGTQVIQSIGEMTQDLSVAAMGIATSVASAVPALFIKLVLMIISTLFIAIDYERLTGFFLRQMNEAAKTIFFQIKEYVVGTL